tara:strand:+ start:604 stop:2283 length:1680 start_codon:yes stop_codon:yes gene_type:complete
MKFITPVLVLILILSVSVPFTPNVQAQNPNSLPDCEANSTLSSWLNFDFDEVNINFHDNWSLGDVNISIDINSPSSFYEYIDSIYDGFPGGNNSWISTDEFEYYIHLMGSCLEDNEIMPGIALAPITSNYFGQNSTYEGPYAFHFDYDELQYNVELDGDVTRSCQNLGASADCVETIVSSNIPITIDLTIPIYQSNETILLANTNFQLAVDMSGLGNYSVDSSRPHTVSFSSNYSVELVAGSNINSTASVLGDTFQFRPSIGYCSGIFSWNNSQQQPSLPEASIMAFTAYQSEYYGSIFMDGSITMYWSVSGTMLPNDFILVNICDRGNCAMEVAVSQNTHTYPGSLTKNGVTYSLRVEVCNEVGCSSPWGTGSVFIQKENQTDSDGDGVPDDVDECPNTPAGAPVLPNGCTEQVETDLDGDGYVGANDSFPTDANEWNDTDGDGVGDNADAFPSDENETHDDDNDGVGNNSDAFPDDPNENVDSDGDGVGDNADPEPKDPEIRTPDDINVEITNESAYLISGSILILAIVILFVRRKQPPQASHQISPFVSEDSMWNE